MHPEESDLECVRTHTNLKECSEENPRDMDKTRMHTYFGKDTICSATCGTSPKMGSQKIETAVASSVLIKTVPHVTKSSV